MLSEESHERGSQKRLLENIPLQGRTTVRREPRFLVHPLLILLLLGWPGIAPAFRTVRSPYPKQQRSAAWALASTPAALPGSFEEKLRDNLRRNDPSPITVNVYATAKRSLGKNLLFLDFCTPDGDLCQAMLRREHYAPEDDQWYEGFRRCLLKGTLFEVTGVAAPTRNPGNAVLLVRSMAFRGFPRQIQHIGIILERFLEGSIPGDQVLAACPESLLPVLVAAREAADDGAGLPAKAALKTLARDLFGALPPDPSYPEAADQKKISRKGNFVVPRAPPAWQSPPNGMPRGENPTPFASIEDSLEAFWGSRSPSQAEVSGWVQNRRRFEGNITVMSLVDDLTLLSEPDDQVLEADRKRLPCVMHPQLVSDRVASIYRNLVSVGCRVRVGGCILAEGDAAQQETPSQKACMWITSIRLVQSSSRSVTIRYLLDLLSDQSISMEEAQEALLITDRDEARGLLTLDATGRRWKANQLAIRLQEASQSMRSVVDPEFLQVLDRYQDLVQMHPVDATTLADMENLSREDGAKEIESLPPSRGTVLRKLPMGMAGSTWQSKKRPQLLWMGERIRAVLESHPDYGTRKLEILDIGGGKGSLAHYLGQAIDNVHIHVVDICQGAVANGENKAQRLNLPVDFSLADASRNLNVTADVVVALHACGHLSDVALAHAAQRRAGFVIVPCCFNSNPHLTVPWSENRGNGKTNLSTSVPVHEWLGLPKHDWSAIKLLAEVQGDIPLANQAIRLICALRAEAARKKMVGESNISIQSFPIEFSTRNTVLVGKCDKKNSMTVKE